MSNKHQIRRYQRAVLEAQDNNILGQNRNRFITSKSTLNNSKDFKSQFPKNPVSTFKKGALVSSLV